VLVDEFHTMPGADYESILSELAKYRANLVLATQSLARLDALDREHQRALKATVFANIDGLFAFNVSAEDARYLARELDDEWVAEQDLVSLGEHRCFVRASQAGQRPPAHSVHLDPPSEGNDERRGGIVRDSRARYGRDLADVEAGLKAALQRVVDCRKPVQASNSEGDGTGAAKDGTTGGPGATAGPHRGPARNENRPQRPRPDPRQTTYLADADASTPDAPAAETTEPAEEAEDAA
jgi:hypothetical protein